MAHVGRTEEALGALGDEHLLGAVRGRAPEGQAVVVVMVGVVREGLLALDEPGRLAVAEPLGRLGQGEADLAELLQWILASHFARSHWHEGQASGLILRETSR